MTGSAPGVQVSTQTIGVAQTPDPATVYLVDVHRLLSLFAQGIGGRYLTLRPIDSLIGDFRPDGATTDGAAIYLPSRIAVFPSARDNLGHYRITVLHQTGFFERGTFGFMLTAARSRLGDQLPDAPTVDDDATDLERFFRLWPVPDRMRRIFMMLENLRIDAGIRRHYPGAIVDLDRALAHARAHHRPAIGPHPLDWLMRHSLGEDTDRLRRIAADCAPETLEAMLRAAAPLHGPNADVIDTAAAAIDCLRAIALFEQQVRATDGGLPDAPVAPPVAPAGGRSTVPPVDGDDAIDGDPASDAMPTDFRGDLRPELVQRQLRARGIVGRIEGLDASGEAGVKTRTPERDALAQALRADQWALRRHFGHADDGARSFLYDEWDCLAQTWRKGWCRLLERRLNGTHFGFAREVRDRHAALAAQIRRQFEAIRPDAHQRIRRVADGDEIELDGLIEAVIDRRAGHGTDEHLYMRRARMQRDVAAAFLLDMSASTDFQIPDPAASPDTGVTAPEADTDEDMPYLWNFPRAGVDGEPEPPKRRVIDVARESLALMSQALHTLGDRHAIYGFSGYGREEVEFFVAKAFEDKLTPRTWAAIGAMEPKRSTRMGTAIRHALMRLSHQDARVRVLMIVSDGFPEDKDYGPDRNDHEYGIQDTAMALREAEAAGVTAFCVTVDRAGHDYLRRMCPNERYLVIDEVAALPGALGKVYRALTA